MAAAVAAAVAPVRPAEVVFPGLAAEGRPRDPDHRQTWVLLMDGQATLWEAANAALGEAPLQV